MKYLLTVELTSPELLEAEQFIWEHAADAFPGAIYAALRETLHAAGIHRCPDCGKRWTDEEELRGTWYELCPECELMAISHAVERDRESMTGENDLAEPLED